MTIVDGASYSLTSLMNLLQLSAYQTQPSRHSATIAYHKGREGVLQLDKQGLDSRVSTVVGMIRCSTYPFSFQDSFASQPPGESDHESIGPDRLPGSIDLSSDPSHFHNCFTPGRMGPQTGQNDVRPSTQW